MDNEKSSNSTLNAVKEFWDNQPCNIKHSNALFGIKEYFKEVKQRRYKIEPYILNFVEFECFNEKDVLEIGCDEGTDSVNFVRNGAHLTIAELSNESLDITKKRFELFGLKAKFYNENTKNFTSFVGD